MQHQPRQENTLLKARGGDLNLIHLTNMDNPGCFGKATPPHPLPLGCKGCLDWGSKLPLRQLMVGLGVGVCRVPSPGEKGAASGVWGRQGRGVSS